MASKVSALRSFLSRLNTRLAMDGSDCEVEGSSSSAPWEDHFHGQASHLSAASDRLVTDEALVRQTAHFPSLSLFGRANGTSVPVVSGVRSLRDFPCVPTVTEFKSRGTCNANDAEKRAVRNLGISVQYTVSDVHTAPERMAGAISSSFVTLVEANLRQYFKRRMMQSPTSSSDRANREVEAEFIGKARRYAAALLDISPDSSASPAGPHPTIRLKGFKTSFQPAPGEAIDEGESDSSAPHSLPIKFQLEINLSNLGNRTALHVEADGRIVGNFNENSCSRFDRVEVELNTSQLLRMMRQKARVVAWMTVASAEEQHHSLDDCLVQPQLKIPSGVIQGNVRPYVSARPNLITPPGSPRYSPTMSSPDIESVQLDASSFNGSAQPRRKRTLIIASVSRKKQHQEREKRT